LPVGTQAAMRFHHHIEEAADHRKLISLVATADHMANYVQRCEDPEAYDVNLNAGFAFLSRDWSAEKINAFARSIPTILITTVDAAAHQANPNKRLQPAATGTRTGAGFNG
ncbi:MAG TPA: hypothetical protein VE988_29015, partial [Gemmataceae bacterium]|nr:hypothetical protein [Gemmataceae bacterium]